MAAETKYIANTGLVTISTANSNLDGTGTLGTVLTAASTNGTLIKTVTIKAQGSPSQGIVRLFVNDGTNKWLLQEIDVDPVEQSGTDVSFEKTIPLDFILVSGYQLLASTQNADTFNVIAEGLDISYYTAYVRPESTHYTAKTGIAAISTGTSSMTGSGSTLLLTATTGKSGTVIESISIKATSATSADGIIRFFIYKESTYYLFTEVFVPYSSQSGTYQSFEHKIVFPEKFQLNNGYSLYVSTQNSDSFHVVANAMDWAYAGGPSVNYTPATISSSYTETILHAYQIPAGILQTGDLISFYGQATVTSNSHDKTFRIYLNTSNSLTGATQIGSYTSAFVSGDNIERMFPVISDTVLECYGSTTFVYPNTRNQYGTTTTVSGNITVPSISAGFWLIISGQNSSSLDTTTLVWSMIEKIF